MRKLLFVFTFILFINNSFGQDRTLSGKLYGISVVLGIPVTDSANAISVDGREEKYNYRLAEQLSNLLKAATYYQIKDYENARFYIHKVRYKFRFTEYNNLKALLLVGSYASLKDIKKTAKYLYIINKARLVDPENMKMIGNVIKNNFTESNFDEALSNYYYYHDRQKILDDIRFDK